MAYAYGMPGEPAKMDWSAIHQSAAQVARDAYLKEYGVDYHDDPKWEIGNERHTFWLNSFDARHKSLIIDPHQS